MRDVITNVRNMFWTSDAKDRIRCEIQMNNEPVWRPYVLSANGRIYYTRPAWKDIVAGKYGPIGSPEENEADMNRIRRETLTESINASLEEIDRVKDNPELWGLLSDEQKEEVVAVRATIEGCLCRLDEVGLVVPMLPFFLISIR